MPEDHKKSAQAVWGSTPAGSTHAPDLAVGSEAFFKTTYERRSTYELPEVLGCIPFATMKDRRVLELGCGNGYDAYDFCRNGARYVGIDITPQNPYRTRAHLAYVDLHPVTLIGDAEALMFKDGSFDVVFSNGVLHHTPDMRRSFEETLRVLAPGGQFWVILYHKHSAFYWLTMWLFEHILLRGYRKQTFKERVARIEATSSGALPLVNVYSRGEVKRLLRQAGFSVKSVKVRKLNREDLPFRRLTRLVPQPVLNAVGRLFGWYVIALRKTGDAALTKFFSRIRTGEMRRSNGWIRLTSARSSCSFPSIGPQKSWQS